MRTDRIENMVKGWFVGNFEPTLYRTSDCEVAYKIYKKGDKEQKHFHKVAVEITLVTKGKVRMFEQVFTEGDIVIVNPGDATSFEAIEDAANIVVKIPGKVNDKYLMDE